MILRKSHVKRKYGKKDITKYFIFQLTKDPKLPLSSFNSNYKVLLNFSWIDAVCTQYVPLTVHVSSNTANVITPHNTINQSLDFNI